MNTVTAVAFDSYFFSMHNYHYVQWILIGDNHIIAFVLRNTVF